MIAVATAGRIYLRRAATDMRKSFDGFSGIVRGELGRDPPSGDLFVFVNRRRDFVKALYWERDGLALWSKRLERGRFAPRPDGPAEIGREELALPSPTSRTCCAACLRPRPAAECANFCPTSGSRCRRKSIFALRRQVRKTTSPDAYGVIARHSKTE